jgi:hypothetical protein
VSGHGRWHAPEPEGAFTHVELYFDTIAYNVGRTEDTSPDRFSAPAGRPR